MMLTPSVPREEIVKICKSITPAKMLEVVSTMNVVEMMQCMQKMRARRTMANQAHVTNVNDNPVQIAADAAEGALRGFAEEETTVAVARYAPLNAISLLVGSQCGRPGVLTQCSLEEATELELGMRGFTAYAETISVYGTEDVFTDGDDTPWSKGFLASAYASRGLKCALHLVQVLKYKWAKQKVNLCCTLKSVAYTSQKALAYKVSKMVL